MINRRRFSKILAPLFFITCILALTSCGRPLSQEQTQLLLSHLTDSELEYLYHTLLSFRSSKTKKRNRPYADLVEREIDHRQFSKTDEARLEYLWRVAQLDNRVSNGNLADDFTIHEFFSIAPAPTKMESKPLKCRTNFGPSKIIHTVVSYELAWKIREDIRDLGSRKMLAHYNRTFIFDHNTGRLVGHKIDRLDVTFLNFSTLSTNTTDFTFGPCTI